MVGVENQGLPAAQLMAKHRRQPGVPPLRHACGLCRGVGFLIVAVDVEVLRLEHLELEGRVLDRVASEVLSLRGRCEAECSAEQQCDANGGVHVLGLPPEPLAEPSLFKETTPSSLRIPYGARCHVVDRLAQPAAGIWPDRLETSGPRAGPVRYITKRCLPRRV